MSLLPLVQEVQIAAEAASSGDSGAHARLLQAIHRLNLSAQTPTETLTSIIHQPKQYIALRAAVEMALPKFIVALEGKSVTAAELSAQTGADATFIGRVMRMLTATGMCDEVGENEYKANAVTRELALPTWSNGLKYSYLSVAVAAKFPEFLQETKFQNPVDKSTFEYTFGKPVWEYLKQNPEQQANMMAFMSGRRVGAVRWFDIYPVTSQITALSKRKSDPVLLVDIGGNKGHDLELFRERHPNLPWRLVSMDLPDVVNSITSPPEGIEMIGYDFFTAQPIKGAHIYYFHGIFHDWSDEHCREILSNTVTAMDEDSRLLINDLVLPNTGAPVQAVALDFSMMTMCAGVERTESQWRELFNSTGLEIVKIWTTEGAEAIIEAKLSL